MKRTAEGSDRETNPPRTTYGALLAGGWETEYARAGAGAPLILVGDPADGLTRSLLTLLAPGRRVFVPEPPVQAAADSLEPAGAAPGFVRWLCDFMDGVGVGDAALVVSHASLAPAALAFVIGHPCRVTHLVLLLNEGAPGGIGGVHEQDLLARAGRPLLVAGVARGGEACQGTAARAAAEAVAAFLDADPGQGPSPLRNAASV
jgi:hypothetical protein